MSVLGTTRRLWLKGMVATATSTLQLGSASASEGTSLVFVLLRGGADGLSLLVPHGDSAYYRARQRTAIAPPGAGSDTAIDLDGYFGLHPRLASLHSLYRRGQLSITVGVGFPEPIASHAEAQRRLLTTLSDTTGRLVRVPTGEPLDKTLGTLAKRLRDQRDSARTAILVEFDGWDTHAGQGGADSGRLAHAAAELDRGVTSFHTHIGHRIDDVGLVVLTEFGRSLTETPMGGTDDGAAAIVLHCGGGVRGGHIEGRWLGLDESTLWQSRHLPVTTDVRAMLRNLNGARVR